MILYTSIISPLSLLNFIAGSLAFFIELSTNSVTKKSLNSTAYEFGVPAVLETVEQLKRNMGVSV